MLDQVGLRGGYYYPCFTDEFEVQRGRVICLRTHSPSLSLTLAVISSRLPGTGETRAPILHAELVTNWTVCPQDVVQSE